MTGGWGAEVRTSARRTRTRLVIVSAEVAVGGALTDSSVSSVIRSGSAYA